MPGLPIVEARNHSENLKTINSRRFYQGETAVFAYRFAVASGDPLPRKKEVRLDEAGSKRSAALRFVNLVFISYRYDSPGYAAKVRAFSDSSKVAGWRLRSIDRRSREPCCQLGGGP